MPSHYTKKTNRPKQYPKQVIADAVSLANDTTIHHAARTSGISTFTIRRHLILAGCKPKPRGCGIHNDHGRRLATTPACSSREVRENKRSNRPCVGFRNR
jgi:hypothetical protein